MTIGILVFPGSNCERDALHVLRNAFGVDAELVWHTDDELRRYDALIVPGGFSYGDYLRAGSIAACSPAMKQIGRLGEQGRPILGICNGFQILAEAGLLPGALVRNLSLRFVCRWVHVRVESDRTPFTKVAEKGRILAMPVAHNEGRFVTDDESLMKLFEKDQVIFTYVDGEGGASDEANPNGSLANIAGVCNEGGNILGLMPHPERASESILSPFGTEHGKVIFASLIESLR